LAAQNEFSFCSLFAIGTFTIGIEKLVPVCLLQGETRLNTI
jgi:hypothetical protein